MLEIQSSDETFFEEIDKKMNNKYYELDIYTCVCMFVYIWDLHKIVPSKQLFFPALKKFLSSLLYNFTEIGMFLMGLNNLHILFFKKNHLSKKKENGFRKIRLKMNNCFIDFFLSYFLSF